MHFQKTLLSPADREEMWSYDLCVEAEKHRRWKVKSRQTSKEGTQKSQAAGKAEVNWYIERTGNNWISLHKNGDV